MARFRYPKEGNGITKDLNGRVLDAVTVSVFLTGTTTLAKIYTTPVGGVAVYSVTSDTYGSFLFYIDTGDYTYPQTFDITYTKTQSNNVVWNTTTSSNIDILASGSPVVNPSGSSITGNLADFSDATGVLLEDSLISKTDVSDAVTKKHAKLHTLISTADHVSAATPGKILKADANGLPIDATNTDTEVASAVSLKHTQNTDTGSSSVTFDVGAGTDVDIKVRAANGDANKPYLGYNHTSNSWVFANDGTIETPIVGAGAVSFSNAAEIVTGTEAAKVIAPDQLRASEATAAEIVTGTAVKLITADQLKTAALNLGAWITPTYSAGNFTGSGSMTWTVASGDVATYAYNIIGKMMTVIFALETTSVTGTPGTYLQIAIPASKTATKQTANACGVVIDNNTRKTGIMDVLANGTIIRVYLTDTANWASSTDLTYVIGQITFEIN